MKPSVNGFSLPKSYGKRTPMGLVSTLAGLIFLGLAGYQVARVWFRLPRGLPATLGGFILAWTWLTLSTLAVGQAGYLTRSALLVCSALAILPALLTLKLGRGKPPDVALSPKSNETLSLSACLAVGLTLWAILNTTMVSLMYPVEVASDGPIYHLYFAAKWWKAGRIFLIPTPFSESAAPYFPAVGDLWHTWLFVNWGGDRLARIGQVPFLLVAMAAVYGLCRKLGASLSASAIATCCFATGNLLLFITGQPNVDTIFIAGYLVACYFAVRYLDGDDGLPALVLVGLAAGAAWGCKAPAIVFVPPLLALIGLAIAFRPGEITRGERVRAIAILALTPFVLEGYWLVRNAIWTGNPLYPLELRVFGRTVLAGWYGPDAMLKSAYYIKFADWRALVDLLMTVFDPRLIFFWLAALGGFWKWGRPRQPGDRFVWAFAGLAVLNIAIFWLFVPYRSQHRFFLHATALAAIPLARLLDRGRWLGIVVVAALALHILTPEGWPLRPVTGLAFWDLSPVPNFSPAKVPLFEILANLSDDRTWRRPIACAKLLAGFGCLAVGFGLLWKGRVWWRRRLVDVVCVSILAGFTAMILTWVRPNVVSYKYPNFPDFQGGWLDLDLKIPPSGTRIAYAGTNLPYYLMGPDFRNDVFYINVNAHPDWALHDYHKAAESLGLPKVWYDTRPGWDRAYPDFDAWIDNLRAAGIKLLVVTRADPTEGTHNIADTEHFTRERIWADQRPDLFDPVYADQVFKAYAVRLPPKNP